MRFSLLIPLLCLLPTISLEGQIELFELPEHHSENAPHKELNNLNAQLDSLFKIQHFEEAIIKGEEVLKIISKKFPKKERYQESALARLGILHIGLNNYQKAKEYIEKAAFIAETRFGKSDKRYCEWNFYLAYYSKNENLDKHLASIENALNHTMEVMGNQSLLYSIQLRKLGEYYKSKASYDKALQSFLECQKILLNTVGEEHPEYGRLLFNMGRMEHSLENKTQSVLHFEKAAEIEKRFNGERSAYYVTLLTELGVDHVYLKNLEFAFKYLKKADNIGIVSTIPKVQLAFYYLKKRQPMQGLEVLESIKVKPRKLNHEYYNVKAKICYGLKRFREALDLYLGIAEENLKEKGFLHPSYGINLIFIANCYEKIGLIDQAAEMLALYQDHLKQRIEHLFHNFSEVEQERWMRPTYYKIHYLQSFTLRNSHNSELRGMSYDIQLLLKEMVLGNSQELVSTLMENMDNEELSAKYKEWKNMRAILCQQFLLPESKRGSDFLQLEKKTNDIEGELFRLSDQFQKAHKKVFWKDVRENLKQGEVAIEFAHFQYFEVGQNLYNRFNSPRYYYVAYILKKDLDYPEMVYLYEDNELINPNSVKLLYSIEPNDRAKNLNQLIYSQLKPYLKDVNKIYFSLTGILNRINFGAIPINSEETIGMKYQLHHVGSTRQLAFRQEVSNDMPKNASLFGGIAYQEGAGFIDNSSVTYSQNNKIDESNTLDDLSLGNSFRGLRGNNWEYLEWTEREVIEIDEMLHKENIASALLRNSDASEEAFKALGSNSSPGILHLATHGYFFPNPKDHKNAKGLRGNEHPMIRSGLILAGANRAWKSGESLPGKEDGILTALEISLMNLSNTELVVLSACNTGLGDWIKSEGVYGLQRAFKAAGAKYILMTLWSVNDMDSYDFMTTFYKNWLENKMTIPEAFRETQGEFRNRNLKPFNPRAWAGFVLLE